MNHDRPSFLRTIDEIASLAGDSRENIIEFIQEDRIQYAYWPDGILIPLNAFQIAMSELYDLEGMLQDINEKVARRDRDV